MRVMVRWMVIEWKFPNSKFFPTFLFKLGWDADKVFWSNF